ncbi:MAG: hypothetical protein ABH837_02985 [bacterium]|nr:hypothetical protein [Patescibacteria group bacterium]
MIRKIISLGKYSAVVSIPKAFMQKLGWRRKQKVVMSARGKSLSVKDYPNK